jgi:hypothetical protein
VVGIGVIVKRRGEAWQCESAHDMPMQSMDVDEGRK